MTSTYMAIPKAAGNVTLESASCKDRPAASSGGGHHSKGSSSSGPKNVRGYQVRATVTSLQ